MAATIQCLDSATLLRLFGQGGSRVEIDSLAEHVEQCSRCGEAIDELLRKDEVTLGLGRSVDTASGPESEALKNLRQRLNKLRPPAPVNRNTEMMGLGSTSISGLSPPAAMPMSSTDVGLTFLAPAQQPDEIGRLGPYRVLKKLGFSHISARPLHPKQDGQVIATFKKTSPPMYWKR